MSEEQVREPGAPYTAPTAAEAGEHLMEQLQVQFPPYFDRFLAERDRRIASELGRLEAAVEHNGAEIARVLREMDHRFAEAKEEQARRFAEAKEEQARRFAEARGEQVELRAEMDHRFAEARGEQVELRAEMDRRFTEAKEDRDHRFTEAKEEQDRRFTEAKEERDHRFAEAKVEREVLRAEMRSQFRWTVGLLFPLVVGVLAAIIRVFFVGTF